MRCALPLVVLTAVIAACGGDGGVAPQITPPVADSINPARGTTGTIVRVMGSGFSDSARVYFSGLQAPKVERSGNQLFVTAPEGLVRGTTYDLRVVNRDGGADTLTATFQAVSPSVSRVNGVTKPTGLVGMTVLIEGDAFGDARHGKIFFIGAGGTQIPATVADSINDWTNNFVVTTVPAGTPN